MALEIFLRVLIMGLTMGANQTGILGGSSGCLKELTEMTEGYRIWPDRISTSYGTQPTYVCLNEVPFPIKKG